MAVIGTAEVEIHSDSSKFAQDAERDIKGAMGGVTDSVGKSAKLIGGALAGAFAVDKVVGFAGSVIGAASDMNETLSKSKNVFGDQAAEIEKWANTSATSFGLSKQAALSATAQYGDMFKQLGFTGDAASKASTNLVKTAADLGSFHNVDPSDVLERIGGALRGEYDSLQQLIPNISAARVEQEALSETHKKSAKELTAAEKATATLAIIQKDGANAANDFAETSGGLANRQRILAAQFEDVKSRIGAGLLPIMTKLAGFVLDNMIPAFEGIGRVVGVLKAPLADFIGGFTKGTDELGSSQTKFAQWGAVAFEQVGKVKTAAQDMFSGFTKGTDELGSAQSPFAVIGALIYEKLAPAIDFAKAKFDEILAFAQEIWPQVSEAVTHVMNVIQDVITIATSVIQELWSRFGDNIMNRIRITFEFIREFISAYLEIVKGVISTVLAIINGDWGRAWDGIKQIFGGVWDAMFAILRAALATFKDTLAVAWDVIKLGTRLAWEGIKDVIGAAFDWLKMLFLNFTGPGLIIKHWDTIRNATSDAFNSVKSTISGAWDSVVGTISGLGGRISGASRGMWDGVRNAFKDAINAIIRGWNNLQFKTPSFDAGPIHYDGITVGVPDIPYLAKGGVVRARSGGTTAVIGEGGSDEAVVPLNQGFVAMLVGAMKEAGVGGGSGVNIENLLIQNNKTFQEQMDEIGRLDLPVAVL